MTTREQLNHERVAAILDLLEQAGVIDAEIRADLGSTRDLGEARQIPEQATVNSNENASRVEGGGSG